MNVFEAECELAGVDSALIAKFARRLEKLANEASAAGIMIFGGAGSGTLRSTQEDGRSSGRLVLASILGGSWDGGDGAYGPDENGHMRGES
jgi:hypothetical protein